MSVAVQAVESRRVAVVSVARASRLILTTTTAVVMLAWVLRVFRINAQSLWYDEGTTAALARRGFALITVDAGRDIHPPLYYYLLHIWTALAGDGEFALRYLSALFGLLTVALTGALARRLFGHREALLAMLVAACSPFLVYYSQEARMYAQAAMLAALSMYLFYSVVHTTRRRKLVLLAYTLTNVALLYTHYFTFPILLAQDIYWLLLVFSSNRPASGRIVGIGLAQAVAAIVFVPWLLFAGAQLQAWPATSEPVGLLDIVYRAIRGFAFGVGWQASLTSRRELAVIVALLVAAVAALRRKPRTAVLLLSWTAAPLISMYVLSLERPMYNAKFLLTLAPALAIWSALGIVALGDCWRRLLRALAIGQVWRSAARLVAIATGAIFFVYPAVFSLQTYYFDPKYARDDYRGVAQTIERAAEPGDAVVLDAPGQIEVFDYYYHGPLSLYPLPKERPIDLEATTVDLATIAARHPRVWLVLWAVSEADPERAVESWLTGHGILTYREEYGSVQLARYDINRTKVGNR